MDSSDSILAHVGNVAFILVMGTLYVTLLAVGTVGKHLWTLLSRAVAAGSELFRPTDSRERRA